MSPRYLTKSRFKLALECPTKLYYIGKKEYTNQSVENPFLEALAEGGFQVGELAKCYYPGGYNVETLDYDQALKETYELLKKDECIIYDAAINFQNLFVRTDLLVKRGKNIQVLEVKAKSTSETTEDAFIGKRGGILSGWRDYVYDVAFQKYVLAKALPAYNIYSYLMLVNKSAICPTEGLNQKFKISRDLGGKKRIITSKDLSREDLAEKLLVEISTDKVCEVVYQDDYSLSGKTLSFEDMVHKLAEKYKKGILIKAPISKGCKSCEFKANEAQVKEGLKSGYHECFKRNLGWEDKDFEEDTIFDIWDFRKADKHIKENRIKLSQLDKKDIGPKPDDKPGISRTQRQWLQVKKAQTSDSNYWIDKVNLSKEMEAWAYPLHFIDFETSMPALPFNKGRHPYEGIAFQFSHHLAHEDGQVEHKGEYLNVQPGAFPNYEFVRRLKAELEKDDGTIFRYAAHENSYLNMIYNQLRSDEAEIPDKEDLLKFIRQITEYRDDRGKKIEGPRNMVDMFELVKRYFYDPYMKGSNSIKVVLPAIINSSDYLKEKYSKPIYGAQDGIPSLNFRDWTWVKFEDGLALDPYKLLPKIFDDLSDEGHELMGFQDELSDGGAAMTAYARLQFEDIPDDIRCKIEEALLKYCELDTLAMVMIYEGWREMVK